jgi:opacity protein-like surface antigen
MLKKILIAAVAALSIGGAMAATSADAAPHGGRGGWHEGWRGGYAGYGWRVPGVFVGPTWGYYGGCGWRWSPRWGRYVRACW